MKIQFSSISKIALALIISGIVVSSCSEPKEVEKYTVLEKRVYSAEDSIIDQYSRIKGDGHSGSYFSRTDSTNQYGIGTFFMINDTMLNKDLRINIDAWFRANKVAPGYVFAVALHDGDKVALWQEIDIKKQMKAANAWTNIVDSITIPAASINKPGLMLKAFAYNAHTDKTIVFDGDDLQITFKNVQKVLEE